MYHLVYLFSNSMNAPSDRSFAHFKYFPTAGLCPVFWRWPKNWGHSLTPDTTTGWTMAGGFLGLRRRLSLSRQESLRSTRSDSSVSIIDTSLSLSQKVKGSPTSVTSKNVEQPYSDGDVLIRTPTSESDEEWDVSS
jgi:hypothetical protein